ncbi:enterobactin synthetase [Streptomyces sp. LP11]|uniref:Enterobactin synthetase n=1 Tax=Streptomyces pyxinicus TaxID=2970331 RepID=A0ABT2B2R7_9ACTN|nr:enterobactin synthetase [Streptomyces sp. LP11]MCS0602717.1 enterobactin synthetase [Streptomyces sp. LP11]
MRLLAELRAAGLGAGIALGTEPHLAPAGPGEAAAIASMPERRRSEFLAGRLAARRALRSVGLDCGDVPRAGRRPLFPPGRAASISHSGGVAVAVARAPGHDTPLGCDLELRPLPPGAARLLLCEDEEHLLHTWPVTALFSAKEAAWKALAGGGSVGTLRDLRAAPGDASCLRVEVRDETRRAVRVRVLAAGPGVFSVVLGGDEG